MILLIFLISCKTFVIKLESPKDFTEQYNNCKNDKDMHFVNAEKIIELKRIIYNLWTELLFADKKNITVIDSREEKDIKKHNEFAEKNN